MGIDAQLRKENGEIVGEVGDAQMVLSRATGSALSGTRLLKYLVPWGDAVFNQAQAADLELDIRDVIRECPDTPLAALMSQLAPLVRRLSQEVHSYLWFVGD